MTALSPRATVPRVRHRPGSNRGPPRRFLDTPPLTTAANHPHNHPHNHHHHAAADWNQTGYAKFGAGNRFGGNAGGAGAGSNVFNFFAADDDADFSLVDNQAAPRTRFGAKRFQQRYQMRRDQTAFVGGDVGQGASRERARQQRMQSKKSQQWNTWAYNRSRETVTYGSSVDIRPEWSVVDQMQLVELTKQRFPVEKDGLVPTELGEYGSLPWFDKSFDRVTPKLERDLQSAKNLESGNYHTTTCDDPVLTKLADSNAGTMFATDQMVASIMCAARSVYGWDLIVTKKNGKVFFDKRDEGTFDLLTVSETAQDAITDEKDNINGVPSLSRESTAANFAFSQQVLDANEQPRKFGKPDPLSTAGDAGSVNVGYRYRKWTLSDQITLVVRCELNGVQQLKGQTVLLSIKALTEFDSKVTGMDWRSKIETQRGAVIATELKNNANKLAKWTCCALLSGADILKLGFVSRSHPKSQNEHVILNTQSYKPKDFAQQINLTETNMWGVFKAVADATLKLPDGKYLLVKDPNKPTLRTYEVPADTFDDGYAKEPME